MSTATTIKERPILFSGPMVRAILDGRKTQTRRIIKPQPDPAIVQPVVGQYFQKPCPYGQPGERLWVRETWAGDDGCGVIYRADHPGVDIRSGDLDDGDQCLRAWIPSIHMPRWASRITLEIVSVRVERLQEIDKDGIRAEGLIDSDITPTCIATAQSYGMSVLHHRFVCLWESINGAGSWEANPWVWVVEFKRLTAEAAA